MSANWQPAYGELILDPNRDADGDGQSNGAETLAGTDPLIADSVFRIRSATVTHQNIRVTWTTVGGHRYLLQAATNVTGGLVPYFFDLSPVISAGGANEGTTNYLHAGGGTKRSRVLSRSAGALMGPDGWRRGRNARHRCSRCRQGSTKQLGSES